jgi:hypothetical protein
MFLDLITLVGDSKVDFDTETHLNSGVLLQWLDIIESLDPAYPILTAKGEV